MMWDHLGVLPSEMREKYPDLTMADKMFLQKYIPKKWQTIAYMTGIQKYRAGTLTKK